ncbi:MAG: molybdopterin-dependent oxidoreductase [bacterium]|nr:molybdopterin-dependent oxidoreductase [bacterium]
MKVYKTACPRNCYSTCSMKVHVEDGRICRLEADPDNKDTPKGLCLKGLGYVERIHSPDRILFPLKRNKETGEFRRIGWEEALDTIAGKIRFFKETHGAQSIFYYAGSGTKGLLNGVGESFWRLCGGYTTTYGDLCWPAGLEATRLTLGKNIHNVPRDIENARLIVLWGKNPGETNVQQMRHIDRALEKGARLIAVDPRRTISTERASLLIQPRPGTDGALALAVAFCLIRDNTIDKKFIDTHVLGFEEFSEMVKEYSPQKVAGITDVPVKFIETLAREIGTGAPISFCPGYGMQRYSNGGQTMRALLALPVITGNIGKPGTGWMYANLQSDIFSGAVPGEGRPFDIFPPEKPDGVARVSVSTSRLGKDMQAVNNPPLKMSWVERGNPVTQNPDTHSVLKAFRGLEFRVVVEQFMTDTAREADIVLPAKSLFEQSDIIGAYWHPYIQLKQKVIEPPGEVKPETEIYRLLAQRLGFANDSIKDILPGPGDIEAFLGKKLEPFPGLSLEKLKEGPILSPALTDGDGACGVAFADSRFPTASGKIELFSNEAETRWGLNPLPVFSEPVESPKRKSGESDKYPLYLMTPNTKDRTHSQFNNLKLIRQFSPKPLLTISADDAADRGISHGERVRLFNDRGELWVEVRIDFSLKKGCVSMSNGWWSRDGGNVNFLSLGRETDMGYGCAFHDCLVDVEKEKKI